MFTEFLYNAVHIRLPTFILYSYIPQGGVWIKTKNAPVSCRGGSALGISVSLFLDQDAVDNLCDADKECEYPNVIRTIYKAPDGQT